MNKWKIFALFLIAASLVWFFFGLIYIVYCLERGIDFFLIWIILYGVPCFLVWYISYRCLKKSSSVKTLSAPPAKQPPVPSPPPAPIFEYIDIDVRRCSKCGEEIGEDYRFCQSCGQVISQEEKLAGKYEIKVQELETAIHYYQGRMMRRAILCLLAIFWMLVIGFIPLDWLPKNIFYHFILLFLGSIYFFLSSLHSGFKVIQLNRTLKKNFTSGEVE